MCRNVWSHAAMELSRPDVRYHMLAIDFLPASVLQTSLHSLSAALAAGSMLPLPDIAHSIGSTVAALRQLAKVRFTFALMSSIEMDSLLYSAALAYQMLCMRVHLHVQHARH